MFVNSQMASALLLPMKNSQKELLCSVATLHFVVKKRKKIRVKVFMLSKVVGLLNTSVE